MQHTVGPLSRPQNTSGEGNRAKDIALGSSSNAHPQPFHPSDETFNDLRSSTSRNGPTLSPLPNPLLPPSASSTLPPAAAVAPSSRAHVFSSPPTQPDDGPRPDESGGSAESFLASPPTRPQSADGGGDGGDGVGPSPSTRPQTPMRGRDDEVSCGGRDCNTSDSVHPTRGASDSDGHVQRSACGPIKTKRGTAHNTLSSKAAPPQPPPSSSSVRPSAATDSDCFYSSYGTDSRTDSHSHSHFASPLPPPLGRLAVTVLLARRSSFGHGRCGGAAAAGADGRLCC